VGLASQHEKRLAIYQKPVLAVFVHEAGNGRHGGGHWDETRGEGD
jgi:hypothetical protein